MVYVLHFILIFSQLFLSYFVPEPQVGHIAKNTERHVDDPLYCTVCTFAHSPSTVVYRGNFFGNLGNSDKKLNCHFIKARGTLVKMIRDYW